MIQLIQILTNLMNLPSQFQQIPFDYQDNQKTRLQSLYEKNSNQSYRKQVDLNEKNMHKSQSALSVKSIALLSFVIFISVLLSLMIYGYIISFQSKSCSSQIFDMPAQNLESKVQIKQEILPNQDKNIIMNTKLSDRVESLFQQKAYVKVRKVEEMQNQKNQAQEIKNTKNSILAQIKAKPEVETNSGKSEAVENISKEQMRQALQMYKNNHIQIKTNIDPRIQVQSPNIQPLLKATAISKKISFSKTNFSINTAGINSQQVNAASFYINLKDIQEQNSVSRLEKEYYEQKYHISAYESELPICVVVPSYNNVVNNRYRSSMNSILQQDYHNFHIVFIDDASTDQTYNKTLQLIIQKKFPMHRISMIRNQVQTYAMHNLRRAAIEFCKPEQIYIIVDGDDELIGRQVFKLYNALFRNTGAYFVYTNFMTPRGSVGYSRPILQQVKTANWYRSYPFVISHLRAFYTKLFQMIDEKDLRNDKGEYFRAANDVAICLPILQMCGDKVEYFPEITYLYNSNTGLNNHMIRLNQQKSNQKIIRRKQSYKKIDKLFEDH